MDEIHFQSVTIFRNCLSITRTVGQQRAMHCTSSPVHSCDVWSLISLKLKLIPTGAWNFASGPDIEPTILKSQPLKLHPIVTAMMLACVSENLVPLDTSGHSFTVIGGVLSQLWCPGHVSYHMSHAWASICNVLLITWTDILLAGKIKLHH